MKPCNHKAHCRWRGLWIKSLKTPQKFNTQRHLKPPLETWTKLRVGHTVMDKRPVAQCGYVWLEKVVLEKIGFFNVIMKRWGRPKSCWWQCHHVVIWARLCCTSGIESWTLTADLERRIQAFENKCYSMLGISYIIVTKVSDIRRRYWPVTTHIRLFMLSV